MHITIRNALVVLAVVLSCFVLLLGEVTLLLTRCTVLLVRLVAVVVSDGVVAI